MLQTGVANQSSTDLIIEKFMYRLCKQMQHSKPHVTYVNMNSKQ